MTLHRAATGAGLAYLVLYLVASQDLTFGMHAGLAWRLAPDWASLWMQARSPFRFEGIAMLEAGGLALIVSPLNLLIAGTLGALFALNVHGVLSLAGKPPACGTGAGLLASLPALLAGGACCAPALVLLVGVPGLGAVAGLFGWLVPLSAALLAATRWWLRRLGAPPWRDRESAHGRAFREERRTPGHQEPD